MGFLLNGMLEKVWSGPDLPDDPDDWAYRALVGCSLSRLSALDPSDEFDNPTPREIVTFALAFVDHWWGQLSSDGDIDQMWPRRAAVMNEPLFGVRDPVGSILDVPVYLHSLVTSRKTWERSTGAFIDGYVRPSGRDRWAAARPLPEPEPGAPKFGSPTSPRRSEHRAVFESLPSTRLLNATLDDEAAFLTGAKPMVGLAELRSRAEQSGRTFQSLALEEAKLSFPGPEATVDEVLAVIATLHS